MFNNFETENILRALKGLCYQGRIKPKSDVLIIADDTSTGDYAVQFALIYGAKIHLVTNGSGTFGGTCDNIQCFEEPGQLIQDNKYDLVFDLAATLSIECIVEHLKEKGIAVINEPDEKKRMEKVVQAKVFAIFSNKSIDFLEPVYDQEDYTFVSELIDGNRIALAG